MMLPVRAESVWKPLGKRNGCQNVGLRTYRLIIVRDRCVALACEELTPTVVLRLSTADWIVR